MTLKHPDRRRAAEDAAQWVVLLHWENSSSVQSEFDAWIRQGPLYLEEFLLARASFENLEQIDTRLRYTSSADSDVIRFLREAGESHSSNSTPLSRSDGEERSEVAGARRHRWHWAVVLAASIAAAIVGGGLFVTWRLGAQTYSTRVGGQQMVKLSDDSMITLNTDTEIRVRMSDQRRSIRLVKGEALFTVAHDAARPFIVEAGRVSVRALGTAFNVRTGNQSTRVAVIEGAVQVTGDQSSSSALAGSAQPPPSVRLEAGDEAEVTDKKAVKIDVPNVQSAVAWRSRKLVFAGERADEIAAEFNRYNTVKIQIESETLRAQRMGGTFDADDPKPLIGFLSRNPGVEVLRTESLIIIRPRSLITFEAMTH